MLNIVESTVLETIIDIVKSKKAVGNMVLFNKQSSAFKNIPEKQSLNKSNNSFYYWKMFWMFRIFTEILTIAHQLAYMYLSTETFRKYSSRRRANFR